jgi:hypothetical protein
VIPRPLAWGIITVLTGLEALNVVAAVFRPGYVSDPLVHFAFTTIVGFMLGMKEGNGAVARAMTAFRNITNPPADPPASPTPSPTTDNPPEPGP